MVVVSFYMVTLVYQLRKRRDEWSASHLVGQFHSTSRHIDSEETASREYSWDP